MRYAARLPRDLDVVVWLGLRVHIMWHLALARCCVHGFMLGSAVRVYDRWRSDGDAARESDERLGCGRGRYAHRRRLDYG